MSTPVGRRYYPWLARFEPIGEYTFRLILSRPWPPFLASLALPQASLVSPGLRDRPSDHLFARTLGSGRYQVYGWKDDTLGLQARPDLASQPPVSLALFHYEPDAKARCQKMLTHGAHLTIAPDCGGTTLPGRLRSLAVPTFSVRFLALNTRRPYTRLATVRRALSTIIGAAFQDRPGRLAGPFPEGLFYDSPGRAAAPPELALTDPLAQSRVVLQQTGPPVWPLVLVYKNSEPGLEAEAETIKEVLAAQGLAVSLQPLAEAQWRRALESGQYDLLLDTRTPEIPAADMWLGRFLDPTSSSEGNPALFDHAGAARLLADSALAGAAPRGQATAEQLEVQRAQRLMELARLADDEAPYVFLYQLEQDLVVDERLERPRGGQEGSVVPHPMWPEVWPLDQTNLSPRPAQRSGANPTGRPAQPAKPESARPTQPAKPESAPPALPDIPDINVFGEEGQYENQAQQ